MLNLISIHPQLNAQYPVLRVHTNLGCINTSKFYTVLCIKMKPIFRLRGILKIIFLKVRKMTTGESLTYILVVFCLGILNGCYSSELNFSACICGKVDHRLIVIFSRQIVRYVLSFMIYPYIYIYMYIHTYIYICVYPYTYADMYNVSLKLSKKYSYPRNRPWRPIGLWDVKNSTLSRQSAHS
jgi:hypothetical protein